MKTLNLDGAKVASILIILSLFLPYMSYDIGVNGEAVEVTGFEMIEGFFEIFDGISITRIALKIERYTSNQRPTQEHSGAQCHAVLHFKFETRKLKCEN